MASLKELRKNREVRNHLVTSSLKQRCPALLFALAVEQYREKPCKLKGIAIFDTFLKKGGLWKDNLGECNPAEKPAHAQKVSELEQIIDGYRQLRRVANGMGRFERWRTSHLRAAAPTVFDQLVDAANLSTTEAVVAKNSQLDGLLNVQSGKTPTLGGWEPIAIAARERLKDAGFDMDRLGLIEIADIKSKAA